MSDRKPPSKSGPKSSSTSTNGAARPSASSTTPRRRGTPPPPPKSSALPIIIIVVVLVVGVVGFILALVLSGGNSGKNTTFDPAVDMLVGPDANAQVQTFPDQGSTHLEKKRGETVLTVLGVPYNSNPPTSGPHLPNWSDWGVFNQPLSDELTLHNLEHGGIVIQYDCPQGCPGAINALSAYARRYPPQSFTGVLLAPRAGGLPDGARIVLTAWTKRLALKSLDTDRINQFISTYIGQGPEKDPNFRK